MDFDYLVLFWFCSFGNFVNRVIKFVSNKYKGIVPDSGEKPGIFTNEDGGEADPDPAFIPEINTLLAEYIETMDAVKLRSGIHIVMQVSARGNLYLQQTEFFKLFDSNPALCAKVTSRALNLIYALTALVHPFMPSTASEMLKQLNAPPRTVPTELSNDILADHELGKPDYLFKKIDEKNADLWRMQFGGEQTGAAAVEVVTHGASAGGARASQPLSKRAAVKEQKRKETVVITPSGPKSDPEIELEKHVKAQGNRVRRIKAGHPEEGDGPLDAAIALLQKLKLDLQELASTHTWRRAGFSMTPISLLFARPMRPSASCDGMAAYWTRRFTIENLIWRL
jgi:methionyl-tRNA synthetase